MSAPRFTFEELIARFQGGLIVSCQALPDEPLFGAQIMAKMAIAAKQAGAVGIRANTPVDVAAIREAVDLPIIGLWKVVEPSYDVYITPKLSHACALAEAGADIIAVDATNRSRPEGTVAEHIGNTVRYTNLPVLADISVFDEAVAARDAGAQFISTTMSGYTSYSPQQEEPDFDLVKRIASRMPVIAEGRISSPEQACVAFDAGAMAVIVGGAITRPQQIAARFVRALSAHLPEPPMGGESEWRHN